jgi:hypothetical protein
MLFGKPNYRVTSSSRRPSSFAYPKPPLQLPRERSTSASGHPRRAYFTFCICRPRNCSPLARIELAGCSFGSVLWARIECDFRARCCLMYGVDHHLE